jgi:predicted small metal-binding protein
MSGKKVMTMAQKLKKIECDPKCGFLVQSHDEKEVIEIAMQNAKKSHNMTITEKDAKKDDARCIVQTHVRCAVLRGRNLQASCLSLTSANDPYCDIGNAGI